MIRVEQVNQWNWDRHLRLQARGRDEANFQDFVSSRADAGEGFYSRAQAEAAYAADPGHAHIELPECRYVWLAGVDSGECSECLAKLARALGRPVPSVG